MSNWETIDFFTDESLVEDPYAYFDELRAAGPVLPLPHLGVVAVSGYDELNEVYHDPDTFSSCNSVVGPYAMFPVPLEGDDVQRARHRSTGTSCRCTSTWSRWTRPTTPTSGRC